MSPHQTLSSRRRKLPVFQISLIALLLVLCGIGIVSSTAQSPQQAKERELEDRIPKHLPIKIKIRNLNSEKLARDLEIEVENRSDKPIYYLGLLVVLPDLITENNHHLGFPLQYGRADLIDYSVPIQQDDVPIKPGESYIFKIPEQLQQGWEKFVTTHSLPKDKPRKVRLVFQSLNFGYGTGFGTIGGVPVNIHEKPKTSSCVDNEKKEQIIAVARNAPPKLVLRGARAGRTIGLFPRETPQLRLFVASHDNPASLRRHRTDTTALCCKSPFLPAWSFL